MSVMAQLDSRLEWTIEADGDAVIARLSGSAGYHQVCELQRCVKAIATRRSSVVVLELSQLDFISSVGLGAIVGLKRSIESHSGKLLVVGPNPAIAEVFRATGLNKVFEIRLSVP